MFQLNDFLVVVVVVVSPIVVGSSRCAGVSLHSASALRMGTDDDRSERELTSIGKFSLRLSGIMAAAGWTAGFPRLWLFGPFDIKKAGFKRYKICIQIATHFAHIRSLGDGGFADRAEGGAVLGGRKAMCALVDLPWRIIATTLSSAVAFFQRSRRASREQSASEIGSTW